MKILVVDDEQDLCEILQFNLENEGYEVFTANSAEDALSLPLVQFSLILLDVMMDEISGFQMARIIRDNSATSHIPIIFITALDSEDSMVKGLNIGADDYIVKPLAMREVKARVKAVLRRSLGIQSPQGLESQPPCLGNLLRDHPTQCRCQVGIARRTDSMAHQTGVPTPPALFAES